MPLSAFQALLFVPRGKMYHLSIKRRFSRVFRAHRFYNNSGFVPSRRPAIPFLRIAGNPANNSAYFGRSFRRISRKRRIHKLLFSFRLFLSTGRRPAVNVNGPGFFNGNQNFVYKVRIVYRDPVHGRFAVFVNQGGPLLPIFRRKRSIL